jgi:hypothetical protein
MQNAKVKNMKKVFIFLFLLFIVLISQGQLPAKINILQMPNKTTCFGGTGYPIHQRVELLDSTLSWRLTHAVTSTQTMTTVFNNHWYVLIGGSSTGVVPDLWQYEVTSDNQNNFTVSFSLASTSEVLYNGYPLRTDQWTGSGTSTLNVSLSTKHFDFITVIK